MVQNQKKARKKKSFRTRFFAALYVLPLMLLAVLVLQRCQKNMERAEKIEKQTKAVHANAEEFRKEEVSALMQNDEQRDAEHQLEGFDQKCFHLKRTCWGN